MISLAALEEKFNPVQRPKKFSLAQSIPQSEDTGMKQDTGVRSVDADESTKKKGKKRKPRQPSSVAEGKRSKVTVGGETVTEDSLSRFD